MDKIKCIQKMWYVEGLNFDCNRCGNCCTGSPGYVWFNDQEALAMAEYLGLSEQVFRSRYARLKYGKWTLSEIRNNNRYDCVFLRRDEADLSLCSIYPVRPLQCQTWPFWPENLTTMRAWREAGRRCDGIGQQGRCYSCDEIRAIVSLHHEDEGT